MNLSAFNYLYLILIGKYVLFLFYSCFQHYFERQKFLTINKWKGKQNFKLLPTDNKIIPNYNNENKNKNKSVCDKILK